MCPYARFLHTAILLPILLLTHLANAQKFQEPTREELQMTSEPKAPGAAAIYLYREQTSDNRSHYISAYVRIKVLTEPGKEWGSVEVPYDPDYDALPIIEARTIHADGTVIPLVGKAEDLLIYKTHDNQLKTAVFNMPSVEVGSILEYKWTILLTGDKHSERYHFEAEAGTFASEWARSTPEWRVQTRLFARKEHFYFNPFNFYQTNQLSNHVMYYVDGELAKYLLCSQILPPGVEVSKSVKNDYTLDIQNVPPIPNESNTPPESSFLYRVRFYNSPYPTPDIYWEQEVIRWSKQVDQFASQSGDIKEAAENLTAGATTPDAKARKLYEAVQALDNTSFTRAKSEAERQQLHLKKAVTNVQEVWSEKSGSSNDIAALYLALARAAGLEAYAVKVADRSRRVFDPNLLSISQIDSLLVMLRIDGKEVFLDPGERLCSYGQLSWKHSLAGGLQQNIKTPIFTPPVPSKDAITARSADLTLDGHGVVTGTAKIVMNGPEALQWRQLNITADTSEVQKRFNKTLSTLLTSSIQGELDHFQALDTSAGSLVAIVKVSGVLGGSTGKRPPRSSFLLLNGNP